MKPLWSAIVCDEDVIFKLQIRLLSLGENFHHFILVFVLYWKGPKSFNHFDFFSTWHLSWRFMMHVYENLLRIQESIKNKSSKAAPKLRPWSRQWSLNCSAKTPQFVPLHGKLHLSLAQPTTRRHQYTKREKQHNNDDCELHVSGLEVAQALRETQSRRLEDFFPFFVVRRARPLFYNMSQHWVSHRSMHIWTSKIVSRWRRTENY